MWRFILVAVIAVGALPGLDTSAHEIKAGDLAIVHPWTVATAGRIDCIVSMTIENHGTRADRLIGATSPVAQRVELHEHRAVDKAAEAMLPLAVDLPPNGVVKLGPKGKHLVLIGLKQPLVAYGSIVLMLKFEKAGVIPIDVMIEDASVAEPEEQ
jgi:copper(I)-binding protein